MKYPLPLFFTWLPSTHMSRVNSCVISSRKNSLITSLQTESDLTALFQQLSVDPFIIILITEIDLYKFWIPWCQKPFVFSLYVIIFYFPETWSSLNKYFIKHTNFPFFSKICTICLPWLPFSHEHFLTSILVNKFDKSNPGTCDILWDLVLAFPAAQIWSFINILHF